MTVAPERKPLTERYVESQVCGLCGNIVSGKASKSTPIGVGNDGEMRYMHKTCQQAFREKAMKLSERRVANG